MILRKLSLKHFGCFDDCEESFKPGINVIRGPNEAGKSTLCSALLTAFFVKPTTGAKLYERRRSWGSAKMYEIGLEFETEEGGSYHLAKDFQAGTSNLTCPRDGESISDHDEVNARLKRILGLGSEALFRSSSYIGQGQVDALENGEISDQLERLVTGGGAGATSEALERLDKAVSEMERGLDRPASYPGVLKSTQDRIEEITDELVRTRDEVEKVEKAKVRLGEIEEELTEARDDLEIKQGVKEKYDERRELESQLKEMHSREEELEAQVELTRRMKPPGLGGPIASLVASGLFFVVGTIGALLASDSLRVLLAFVGFAGLLALGTSFVWYRKRQKQQREVAETRSSLQGLKVRRKEVSRRRRDAEERLEESEMAQVELEPEEYEQLIREIADVDIEVKRLEEELVEKRTIAGEASHDREDVHRLEAELTETRQQLQQEKEQRDAYKLAREVIAEAQEAAITSARPLLEKKIARYLARITGGRYTEVQVDEKLNFWIDCGPEMLPPVEDVFGGAYYNLSKGTIDQLYLAARLALPAIIAGDRHPPLIFDDPFVRFDEERMERTMELCQEVAQEYQILVLTCRDVYDRFADHVIEL